MKEFLNFIKKLYNELPKFEDGRIDYTNAKEAAVLTIFLKHGDEILILKRSEEVGTYKNKWSTVTGYFDEIKSIEDKVFEELREEIGLKEKNIGKIIYGRIYKIEDKELNKKWIILPALIELKKKIKVKLDWEHASYRWIKIDELKSYDTVPNLKETLEILLEEGGK